MTTDHDREPLAAGEPSPAGDEPTPTAEDAPVDVPEADDGTSATAPDYKDRWLRAEADLQNFRRRAVRERDEVRRGAEERVLLDLIAVLDDLERALAALGERAADDPLAQGVTLVAQRMRDVLASYGVQPIASVGQPFDPNVHEALLEVDAPEGVAPGHVVQEAQRGWRSGDRALRAARVVVARARADA